MIKKLAWWGIAAVAALLFLYPILATVTGSFFSLMDLQESYLREEGLLLRLVPRAATLDQYYLTLVSSPDYVRYFLNSAVYALPITLLGTLLAVPAGYVLAKVPFRGSGALTFLLIIAMVMPFQVTLVANYILVKEIGLFDTVWAIILTGAFAPFAIFFSRQMCASIPDELLEAYDLESKSLAGKFAYVILPTVKPALAALMILTFTEAWNMVEQPLILLESRLLMPLSTVLNSVFSSMGMSNHFAGAVLYMVPVLLIFYYCETYIMDGLQKMRFMG